MNEKDKKRELEKRKTGQMRMDVVKATPISIGSYVLMRALDVQGLVAKLGLPEKLVSSGNFLVHTSLNIGGGFYSGFTGRNYVGGAFYFLSCIPNLIDTYNNEDFSSNMQSFAIKTGVLFGSWALGSLTRKTYDFAKSIYSQSH